MDLRIQSQSVQDLTARKLREAIFKGIFKPGEKLVEANLCEQIGVSRGSLREALRQLAAEKLIDIIPNRGPFVAELRVDEARQLYHVRALLGDRIAEFTAERAALRVDCFADGAAFRDFFKANYGPTIAAYRGIAGDPDRMEALDAQLMPVFAKRPAIWWLRTMQRHRVPCAIAHNFEQFRYHEQVVGNDMVARLQTRDWGEVSVAGLPWHFTGTPCAVTEPARPGEHTEEVLADLAARARYTQEGK